LINCEQLLYSTRNTIKTAEFKYLLLKYKRAVISAFQPITQTNVMLHFLANEKHPFCSQYSLISGCYVNDVTTAKICSNFNR